ncbi:MAG TPA: hypothetical protein VLN57_21015 [Xanthobacteraceae bacterium]|nr:hypothetical protein [Xanthobacteraceae bacterium]
MITVGSMSAVIVNGGNVKLKTVHSAPHLVIERADVADACIALLLAYPEACAEVAAALEAMYMGRAPR